MKWHVQLQQGYYKYTLRALFVPSQNSGFTKNETVVPSITASPARHCHASKTNLDASFTTMTVSIDTSL
jgi:hypothetical protein